MFYFLLAEVFSLLLDLFATTHRSEHHKDLEILMLRQMERSAVLRILQRQHPLAPRVSRWEKLMLAVLATKLVDRGRAARHHLNQVALLFKPDTILKWHRELVRRKWTFRQQPSAGLLATDPELQVLLLRLAQENPTWGYGGAKQAAWRVA